MPRRTKIVATLGPASSDKVTLLRMIEAGLDVVRMNFSHGTAKEHTARVELVRELARKAGRSVGVLVDLQGPKIRIGRFEHDRIELNVGDKFVLDAECKLGDAHRVGLDYKNLPQDVSKGDTLLLDDGRVVLAVVAVRGTRIDCVVEQGGTLSNNKGINRKGGGLTAPALTEKDMQDIKTAALLKADYLAVSFPRSGADMQWARDLMLKAGGKALLCAKIERAEAIPALEEIVDASDSIMVARGDLAVEVGDAVVPALQKRMIRMARERNKLVITATQMMESMINNPIQTRAEVSDVANAVLDGTDAVMLSAETAAGKFPVETIAAMARVCLEAEKEDAFIAERRRTGPPETVEEAVARATIFTANSLGIKAIAALTQSGKTALLMSRMNSSVPIYALSSVVETRRRVTLFRGVYPLKFKGARDPERSLNMAEDELLKRGAVRSGDYIILTIGEPFGKAGGTNTMKIVKVGEHRRS
ncbi:MAG: pyruvate kinase [Betaproteobacteria bacterium]|nr:pyruvate kinase [Betaproteobacteria bacterium]